MYKISPIVCISPLKGRTFHPWLEDISPFSLAGNGGLKGHSYSAQLAMHPQLAKHRHPECLEEIDALRVCHKTNPIAKFIGRCNKPSKQLDDCLYQEVGTLFSSVLVPDQIVVLGNDRSQETEEESEEGASYSSKLSALSLVKLGLLSEVKLITPVPLLARLGEQHGRKHPPSCK